MATSTFATMLKANMEFYIHTKRLRIFFPVYIALAVLFPILYVANILPKPPDLNTYAGLAWGNLVFAAVLLVGLLGGDAISQDFGRQGFFTLTQPVRRSEIMLARSLAAFVFSALTILVWMAVGLVTGYAFYQSVVSNVGLIFGLSVLLVGSLVSFVVMFSSLFKTPNTSVVVVTMVVWFVMPIVTGILELVGIEPWFLIYYAGGAIIALTEPTYPQHSTTIPAAGGGQTINVTTFTPYVWEAALIMVGYLVASLVLAWIIYSRKELKDI
jgi:ABC-type transport system involved in multi-copper enzyme maturation permease subunit